MADSLTLIQGTRLRATRIDGCGQPVPGANGQVVTDGFISVALKDNVETGDEFKVKLASGQFCVNQRSKPELNWIEAGITVCQVSPELFEMLTGSDLVYDAGTPPKAVGIQTTASKYATASFALELWTNIARSRGAACAGSQVRYGYLLLPWLVEGVIGDLTFENGPVSFVLNAITASGTDWGVGPYDVVQDALGQPSPLLDPLPTDAHRHLQFTEIPPPPVVVGYQPLVPVS